MIRYAFGLHQEHRYPRVHKMKMRAEANEDSYANNKRKMYSKMKGQMVQDTFNRKKIGMKKWQR